MLTNCPLLCATPLKQLQTFAFYHYSMHSLTSEQSEYEYHKNTKLKEAERVEGVVSYPLFSSSTQVMTVH